MLVTVIGLGYVGLPLALLARKKGHTVIGIDISKEKIEAVSAGKSPFADPEIADALAKESLNASTDISTMKDAEVVIVCVPTPVDKDHKPDMRPLVSACTSAAEHLAKGALFIVESTIYPGTVQDVVNPILRKAGLEPGKDVFVAHCPERIDPGSKTWPLHKIPRVVGGMSPECTARATQFYRSILDADVMELSTVEAAEATKVVENTFRDINIAFVNEMAMGFSKAGIDVLEVIKGAATKPFAFMPHYPGCGVGGHCIPVDPYYLIERGRQMGFDHRFLRLGREVNQDMPKFTVSLLIGEIKKQGDTAEGAKVGLMGAAYKPGIDDMRESPYHPIKEELEKAGATIRTYDPFVPSFSDVKSADELLSWADHVVLVTGHKAFLDIDPQEYKEKGIKTIVDGRNALDKDALIDLGIAYRGIGR
ncbi:MAG: nucleotide sugar dehydrogenase [archaeon]